MALSDHFREFRARIVKIALIWLVGFAVSLVFHDQLLDLVFGPYEQAQKVLPEGTTEPIIQGAGAPLMVYLKLSALATSVLTAPLWLYQFWAFVLPGLHRREKKWTAIFVVIAGPLFLLGVLLGYLTLPKGLEVLIGFTPDNFTNLVDFNEYLSFFSRTLLVFGIAFEIPVFVVLLNLAGVVKGESLGKHRAWMVIGVFVFAALATPSTDPFTMTALAVPMVLLFLLSEGIARFNDRRRAARDPYAGLSPDEASAI
ncbi:twin-arginine translocase subunit TatC [Nocardioides cavernaquae]|uniref:Sec-independent protein translocase protein TatC n=2 Tax=Nocardioides cavernaquae TaxID=2321396 RepID=A0A3A5HD14_9ACTN|nr:twin-arginine translocase subunit TatC [Nocardioides cavernaquae]RJS48021.1 twin-arginine translocase subunit TatC [Nocardioides cavernaquae]RJS48022.1 twin-arginine translocase subunit TatC [Nocardioides cavernaquae]